MFLIIASPVILSNLGRQFAVYHPFQITMPEQCPAIFFDKPVDLLFVFSQIMLGNFIDQDIRDPFLDVVLGHQETVGRRTSLRNDFLHLAACEGQSFDLYQDISLFLYGRRPAGTEDTETGPYTPQQWSFSFHRRKGYITEYIFSDFSEPSNGLLRHIYRSAL